MSDKPTTIIPLHLLTPALQHLVAGAMERNLPRIDPAFWQEVTVDTTFGTVTVTVKVYDRQALVWKQVDVHHPISLGPLVQLPVPEWVLVDATGLETEVPDGAIKLVGAWTCAHRVSPLTRAFEVALKAVRELVK